MAIPDASHVFIVHWTLMPGDIVTENDAQYFKEIGDGTYRLVSVRHDGFWRDKELKRVPGMDNVLCADYEEAPGKPVHLTIVFFEKLFDHQTTKLPVWTLLGDLSTGTCASTFGEISKFAAGAQARYAEIRVKGAQLPIAAPPQWGGENGQ